MLNRALTILLCLCITTIMIEVGFLYYHSRGNTVKTPPPTPTSTLPVVTPTKNPVDQIITYSGTEQNYTFQYYQSWKVETQATLMRISDPNNQDSIVLVYSIPYAGLESAAPGVTVTANPPAKTHTEQVADLIKQIAKDSNFSAINTASLTGYETTSITKTGNTHTVLFQGEKTMLLVQFPNYKNQSGLDGGQLLILNTLKEK